MKPYPKTKWEHIVFTFTDHDSFIGFVKIAVLTLPLLGSLYLLYFLLAVWKF